MNILFAYLILNLAALEVEADSDRPSKAFLEFLGSFENVDGEWVDPLSLPEEIDDSVPDHNDRQHDEKPDQSDEEPAIEM